MKHLLERYHARSGTDKTRCISPSAYIWLARVDVEIVGLAAFESALIVRAHGSALGTRAGTTSVFGLATPPGKMSSGRIVIRNTPTLSTDDAGSAPVRDEVPEWTAQEGVVDFEIRPLGGGGALAMLAPDTTYELHYRTSFPRIDSYLLSVSGPAIGAGLGSAVTAPVGPWAHVEQFEYYDCASAETPLVAPESPGYYVLDVINGFWTSSNGFAGSVGHLCNFTTGPPGPVRLDLFMQYMDATHPVARRFAWMRSHADYVVQQPIPTDGEPDA
jgi:hypothetical protein